MSALPHGRSILTWISGRAGSLTDRTFRVRLLVQAGFAFTCVLLGIQFARFYTAAMAGATPLPTRPPGAEAFLPISGLMGILDWFYQGALNPIHPAATVLVVVAILLAILLRKSFCSWICPVGFFSELLARFGRWSFGRNFRPWKWLDIPLRSLKYLLMAFFVVAVVMMGAAELADFISSPYNKVADVKMGLFFVHMSQVGIIVMGSLAVGSVFIQGFWCRYMCPYGALLGLFSWMSPTRVKRNESTCISCERCDAVCMARLPVSKSLAVVSTECTGCLDCLAVCPVKDTLVVQVGGRRVSHLRYAAAVVGLFAVGYVGAQVTGLWHNQISDEEYVERIQNMNGPEYGHPGMDGP